MIKRILKQAILFVGVSGVGWLIDFFVFTVLTTVYPHVVIDNFISSLLATTFVFLFATRKVFNNGRVSLIIKYLIYLLYQIVLILAVSEILGLINAIIIKYASVALLIQFSELISKVLVTPITLVVNFIVMKILVERL